MSQMQWAQLEHTFEADIEEVWQMWADSKNFQKWYGPNGATLPVAEMDVQVGGKRKVCMEMVMPNRTMQMWFSGEYVEVRAPNKLVYTEAMCDPDGNVISPSAMGMPEGTPETTEIQLELSYADGKTKMILVHQGVPAGSPGEGGWKQAIDKLAAQLG